MARGVEKDQGARFRLVEESVVEALAADGGPTLSGLSNSENASGDYS